ncbi:MAG: TonB family protein [Nostoc sp.]|uniref:TonB family protein n=1 Tax=Nostoc sp. TaxID=1180 RepID=UPI002FFA6606
MIPEPKQEISQEIPIEIVEVPPQKTDITPQTSLRATKNSLAGGKALPERPVLGVKSGNLAGQKADNERSFDLTASSPLKVLQTGRQQQKTELPNRFGQQPQFKSPKTASASASEIQVPNSQKIAVAPMTTPLPVPFFKTAPNPKQIPLVLNPKQVPNAQKIAVAPITTPQPVPLLKTAPLTTPLVLNPKQVPNAQKIAVAPITTPQPVPLLKTAPLTTPLVLNPKQVPNAQKIAVAPITTPQPAQLGKTALERATTLPVPRSPKKLRQSRVGFSRRTPTQAQSSLKTGAASLLGGTVGVSSQNYRGDQLAAVPNSNRDRIGTSGVDASSQDVDLTSYLNKLKQRVQQQWLPGMSQSNRRTVLNFTINRSGEVNNLNIVQTSGSRVTDEVAMNAIQRSAPFAPLPTGYRKNYIDIEFTFSINVYGQLNLSRDGG